MLYYFTVTITSVVTITTVTSVVAISVVTITVTCSASLQPLRLSVCLARACSHQGRWLSLKWLYSHRLGLRASQDAWLRLSLQPVSPSSPRRLSVGLT